MKEDRFQLSVWGPSSCEALRSILPDFITPNSNTVWAAKRLQASIKVSFSNPSRSPDSPSHNCWQRSSRLILLFASCLKSRLVHFVGRFADLFLPQYEGICDCRPFPCARSESMSRVLRQKRKSRFLSSSILKGCLILGLTRHWVPST